MPSTNRDKRPGPPAQSKASTPADANTLALRYIRRRIETVLEDVVTAALAAAFGARHVYEKNPVSGQWARVTDADQVTALLPMLDGDGASGNRVVISTQDGDARLLEGLLAVYLGVPFDSKNVPDLVGLSVNAETGETTVEVKKTHDQIDEAIRVTVQKLGLIPDLNDMLKVLRDWLHDLPDHG